MEMRFDPMTGEPINPQPQENAAQETGANTKEQTADAAQDVNAGTQDVSAGTQGVNPDAQQMNQQMEGSGAQQGNSQGETYSAGNGQPPYMPQTPADAPKNKNWIKGIAIAGGAAVVVIVAEKSFSQQQTHSRTHQRLLKSQILTQQQSFSQKENTQ